MALADQTHATDRARVSVITRAVRMTVEDGMFYSDKEVDQAATLLKIAESKLGELKKRLNRRRPSHRCTSGRRKTPARLRAGLSPR